MVDDADALVERAVAAGARVPYAITGPLLGARYGKIVDPFGHEWGINQQLKEQSRKKRRPRPPSSWRIANKFNFGFLSCVASSVSSCFSFMTKVFAIGS
jgi:hypothetical protein